MQKSNPIRIVTVLLVALFISSSIIGNCFNVNIGDIHHTVFAKKSDTHGQPHIQIPYEEREKEEENGSENKTRTHLVLICFAGEFLSPAFKQQLSFGTSTAPRLWACTADVPIYLALRVLLI